MTEKILSQVQAQAMYDAMRILHGVSGHTRGMQFGRHLVINEYPAPHVNRVVITDDNTGDREIYKSYDEFAAAYDLTFAR